MTHDYTKPSSGVILETIGSRTDPELLFSPSQIRFPQHSFIFFIQGFVHARTAISHIEVYVSVLLYPEPQSKEMERNFTLLSC